MRSLSIGWQSLLIPAGAGSGASILITKTIPSILVTKYAGAMVALQEWRRSGSVYVYRGALNLPNNTDPVMVEGIVSVQLGVPVAVETARWTPSSPGGAVLAFARDAGSKVTIGEIGHPGVLDFPNGSSINWEPGALVTGGTVTDQSTRTFDASSFVEFDGALVIDAFDAMRARRAWASSTAATAAIGAEAVVLTISSFTFKDGRAYEVHWQEAVAFSAAATCNLRIRRTNLAGAVQAFVQHVASAAKTENYLDRCIFVRAAGSGDLTDTMVLTAQASAGTVTLTGSSSAQVRYLDIRDCGPASDFSGARGFS